MLKFLNDRIQRPIGIQFFEELNLLGQVKGYWKTPDNTHSELQGMPQLTAKQATKIGRVPVGTITRIGNLKLRRLC